MIYYFLYPLHAHPSLSFLNVLRYVPFRALAATMTAHAADLRPVPVVHPPLQSQADRSGRPQGRPASHFSKAGTPTMGGALILLALVGSTVLWADPRNTMVWLVTAVTALYGGIGYVDDAAKITQEAQRRSRRSLQAAVAVRDRASPCAATSGTATAACPPDWHAMRDRLSRAVSGVRASIRSRCRRWLYVAFAAFVIVGTSNAREPHRRARRPRDRSR